MSNYTPGPWQYAIDGDRSVIAPIGGTPVICQAPKNKRSENPEWIANARLIAAAPEMLEALGRAYASMKYSGWPEESQVLACVEKAIAKAAGETE